MKAKLKQEKAIALSYWEELIDRELHDISSSIDFLYLVQPANIKEIETDYLDSGIRKDPSFTYKPLPTSLNKLKQRLVALPLNKITDPCLRTLFQKERKTLNSTISLLRQKGHQEFLKLSIELFGEPDQELIKTAKNILTAFPGKAKGELKNDYLTANEFQTHCLKEINYYKRRHGFIEADVEIREDLSSLLVSGSRLILGSRIRIPRSRVDATLSHEIGTHMLTYWNGRLQPLSILSSGLSNYEEVQEGLAVFMEYLAGGLTRNRLRTLAARVLAVSRMQQGCGFSEVFQELTEEYGLGERIAFDNTVRVFRGGGMTRPAVYLRGLLWILEYLRTGGDLNDLLIGKIGTEDISLIEDLTDKGLILAPLVKPKLFKSSDCQRKLDKARSGMNVIELASN